MSKELKKFSRLSFIFLFLFENVSCGDVNNNTILGKFKEQSIFQGFKVDNMLPLDWLACKGHGIYSSQEFQNLQARRDEIDKKGLEIREKELTMNKKFEEKKFLLDKQFNKASAALRTYLRNFNL